MELIDNVILRGHYCKIEKCAGNKISKLIITGFNNKVFFKAGDFDINQYRIFRNIEVIGHNNRVETIISNNLRVTGHNNWFW